MNVGKEYLGIARSADSTRVELLASPLLELPLPRILSLDALDSASSISEVKISSS